MKIVLKICYHRAAINAGAQFFLCSLKCWCCNNLTSCAPAQHHHTTGVQKTKRILKAFMNQVYIGPILQNTTRQARKIPFPNTPGRCASTSLCMIMIISNPTLYFIVPSVNKSVKPTWVAADTLYALLVLNTKYTDGTLIGFPGIWS